MIRCKSTETKVGSISVNETKKLCERLRKNVLDLLLMYNLTQDLKSVTSVTMKSGILTLLPVATELVGGRLT